ncbi:hypothetical protein QBC35DRAFT_491931 [Podospora australis]|uniref:Uncharacterized protein n=1 Tax=Podospora australis TaxID=1536484 RepID=A0AAN7ALI6_9PEZI|nr:hypothetical protein QBC35DRAFT_491931 [Podospora australis]
MVPAGEPQISNMFFFLFLGTLEVLWVTPTCSSSISRQSRNRSPADRVWSFHIWPSFSACVMGWRGEGTDSADGNNLDFPFSSPTPPHITCCRRYLIVSRKQDFALHVPVFDIAVLTRMLSHSAGHHKTHFRTPMP